MDDLQAVGGGGAAEIALLDQGGDEAARGGFTCNGSTVNATPHDDDVER